MNKKIFVLILFIITIISVGYLYFYKQDKSIVLKTPTDISFSPKWVNQAQFAGVFVAKDFGYYKDSGINLSIKEFKIGNSVLDDLKSGKSQLGLMSANEFLINYSKGEKIKAVAVFYQVSPFVTASLRSNPINSPTELKGKKLGIKGGRGGESELIYDLLLKSAGLSSSDVEYVVLPFGPTEKEDLVSKKAEFVGFYRTGIYKFEEDQVPFTLLYPEQYGASLYNDVLVTTDDFLQDHSDAIQVFINQTIKGWEYSYKNIDKAIEITMPYITSNAHKDVKYQTSTLKESEFLMKPQNGEKIGYMDNEHWERYYEILNNRGFFVKQFDVHEAFTTKFIE